MTEFDQVMYQVGRTYRVPAMHFGCPVTLPNGNTLTLDNYLGFTGWLPLLLPPKEDESFVSTLPEHAHIDYRFLSDRWYAHFERWHGCTGSELFLHVVLFGPNVADREQIRHLPIKVHRMKCRRQFEALDYSSAHYMPRLQEKYVCAALLNGKCPHRGTPVAAMIEKDGALVCPAHGLRWAKTGELKPYDEI